MKFIFFILFSACFFSLTLNSEDINKKGKKDKKDEKAEYLKYDNTEASKLALEKLQKPLTKQWNTSLNEVCKDISSELGVKIEIDKVANAEGSIEFSVNNLSGIMTLKWILASSGCEGNIKEGILYITLKEKN